MQIKAEDSENFILKFSAIELEQSWGDIRGVYYNPSWN